MKLHFLGTTGYHPNRRRDTACLMIPEAGVLLDAGTGIFRARDLIETPELHIFLSHAHLDHVIGLTFLLDVVYDRPVQRIVVYCDPAKIPAIRDHLFNPHLFPVAPPFEVQPLGSHPVALPMGGTLTSFPLVHPGGCLGFRLEWPGRSMAYVTDTMATPEAPYERKIAGVNLLVHEAYFPDGCEDKAELTGHSCLTPVVELARRADVGQLYLVHLNPLDEANELLDLELARQIFPRTFIPEDDMEIEF